MLADDLKCDASIVGAPDRAHEVVRVVDPDLVSHHHDISAPKFGVATNNVVSQSVPHLHVHVVPRTKGDGLKGFFWPRTKYADAAERDGFAQKIAAAL